MNKPLTIRDVPLSYELITSSWNVNALNQRYGTNYNAFFIFNDDVSVYGIEGVCLACDKPVHHVHGIELRIVR